jgi:hypothetical protein
MPLVAAGQHWLEQIARPNSRLSHRTIADYACLGGLRRRTTIVAAQPHPATGQ